MRQPNSVVFWWKKSFLYCAGRSKARCRGMTTTITDYVSVHERTAELGCQIPRNITLLPENFDSAQKTTDFLQLSEAATVRTLFRSHCVLLDELLPAEQRPHYIQYNSVDWVAPTLFISSAVMTENPTAVSLAISVLANYLSEFFKGMSGKTAKLDIVVERKRDQSCKKLSYEGDVAGLSALPKIIQRLSDD
jgi:hypothetical protein